MSVFTILCCCACSPGMRGPMGPMGGPMGPMGPPMMPMGPMRPMMGGPPRMPSNKGDQARSAVRRVHQAMCGWGACKEECKDKIAWRWGFLFSMDDTVLQSHVTILSDYSSVFYCSCLVDSMCACLCQSDIHPGHQLTSGLLISVNSLLYCVIVQSFIIKHKYSLWAFFWIIQFNSSHHFNLQWNFLLQIILH